MKITQEEGREIIWDDHPDWIAVEDTQKIIESSRWSLRYEGVFQHTPSGKHYKLWWSTGATEQQDEQPFEYDEPNPLEVEAKSVTVIEWVKAKKEAQWQA